MSINGFPIQILLHKSKEKSREVISRLLFTFASRKLQENLNFSKNICFTIIIHKFRKYSINYI